MKVLFGGGGITGTAASWFVQRALRADGTAASPVWRLVDRAPHLGGRFASHPYIDEAMALHGHVNSGAQYLTQFTSDHDDVFDHLLAAGVIEPFNTSSGRINGIKAEYMSLPHFTAPKGMDSIARGLLADDALSSVRLGSSITAIDVEDDGRLRVTTENAHDNSVDVEHVTCLVLSVPPPHLWRIGGNVWQRLRDASPHGGRVVEALRSVQYSSRYALAVYFSMDEKEAADTLGTSAGWSARYVFADPDVRYVSTEVFRSTPHAAADDATRVLVSVLLHSSLPFYATFSSRPPEEATEALLASLRRECPWSASRTPLATQLVAWDVSQCSKSYGPTASAGSGGVDARSRDAAGSAPPAGDRLAAVHVDVGAARVVFAGDYFTTSNFEGCLDSARAAADLVVDHLRASS